MTAVILAESLTEAVGPVTAVEDPSFELDAGRVTGFLGPHRRLGTPLYDVITRTATADRRTYIVPAAA